MRMPVSIGLKTLYTLLNNNKKIRYKIIQLIMTLKYHSNMIKI